MSTMEISMQLTCVVCTRGVRSSLGDYYWPSADVCALPVWGRNGWESMLIERPSDLNSTSLVHRSIRAEASF
jgi:hypothetical protein